MEYPSNQQDNNQQHINQQHHNQQPNQQQDVIPQKENNKQVNENVQSSIENKQQAQSKPNHPLVVKQSDNILDIANELPPKNLDIQPQINIKVVEQIVKGNALMKTYSYKIIGKDIHGNFQLIRKYSQFIALRNILRERWPGCFIPSFSDECDIKNAQQNVDFKLRWLTHFLKCLSKSPFIYYKEQIQLFLRNSPDLDIKHMFEQMPYLRVIDVIERFRSSFGMQVQKQPQLDNEQTIANFSTSLKKILNSLQKLANDCLTLGSSYQQYVQKMVKFGDFLKHYQQFSLAEYTDYKRQKSIIIKDQQQNIDKLKLLFKKNPFYQIYQLIILEIKDSQSFLDIIYALQNFVQKRQQLEKRSKQTRLQIDQLKLGHKSLKLLATRKTKQQVIAQLQSKQKSQIQDKINVSTLYNILQIVLSTISIKIYKKIKKQQYHDIIKLWINTVKSINPQLSEMWKFWQQQSKNQLKQIEVK